MDMDVTTVASPASIGSCARIYGPRNFEDDFRMAKTQDEITRVLAKIESIYDEQVQLDDELVVSNGGFCFGLLAPATNVLVNTVISSSTAAPPAARGGGNGGRDMNRRSLDGLIAFLTCLFPYLPDAEALAYLDAADADPLAAALLVIRRRGLRRFGFSSGTTAAAVDAAIRCAAAAANHPDPWRLVLGWKLLSRSLNNNNSTVADDMTPGSAVLRRALADAADGTSPEIQLEEPWKLAGARLDDIQITNKAELPPSRAAAKRKLLEIIHGFYLQALARLPTAELRGRYHRGVLAGGGCYGPLDPVSNIIVNAVWYEQTFPASKQVTLDMVSTECLWRAAARSLYGLVSFLCTRYPGMSPDQALHRLQVAGANLQLADPNLFDDEVTTKRSSEEEEQSTPATGAREAYAAAATAAFHPSPLAQKELLRSPDVVYKLKVASETLRLQDGRMLSSEDLELLSMVLLNCSSSSDDGELPQQQVPAPVKVRKRIYAHVSLCSDRFWFRHERDKSMVAAALEKFNETAVPKYRLHVICGINELVSGPEFSLDMEIRGYNPYQLSYKYHHSHINFLATCEGTQCAGSPATLFFAECSNHDTSTCWCAPVNPPHPDAEQVRCIYCEHQGVRIVHPDERNFHGRDDFEKLFYGLERESYGNDKIILRNRIDQVHDMEDDSIYLNYCIDDDDDYDEDDFMELHIS